MSRPKKPPTEVIRVPVDRLHAVEKLLDTELATKYRPYVNIRVPKSKVDKIRRIIQIT